MRIEAKEGFTFRRIHDGFIMGEIIYLGIDYSTGEPREDKEEYYEEVKDEMEFLKNESIWRKHSV
jgi:hypothetical protein